MHRKDIAIKILPRALWGVMVFCLFLGEYLTRWPPVLTENILLLYLGIILSVIGFLFWMRVGHWMIVRCALLGNKELCTNGPFNEQMIFGVRHDGRTKIIIVN